MLFVPVILAAVIWFWPSLWFRAVKSRLDVTVRILTDEVEIGDVAIIELSLKNRAWLPCPHVEVSIELPQGMSASADGHGTAFVESTYLLMRQEVKMQFSCYGLRRGLQDFGHREMILRMNEGFAIKELFITRRVEGKVRVLPKRGPFPDSILAIRELNGDLERTHWLMPDEALLRGIREYEPGDPFKYISWQATARSGTWMTKQFSSSVDLSVGLVLNAQFFEPHWIGTDIELFDELCSRICAIGEFLEKRHIPFHFASNAVYPKNAKTQWFGLQTAWSMRRICSTFAPYTTSDLSALLHLCSSKLPKTSALVVATGFVNSTQGRQLEYLAKSRPVVLLCPSTANLPALRGIKVLRFKESTAATTGEEAMPV